MPRPWWISLALLAALLLSVVASAAEAQQPPPEGQQAPQAPQAQQAQGAGSEEDPTHEISSVPQGTPRYLPAMQHELTAMHIEATCDATDTQRARCAYTHRGATTNREFPVRVIYSDRTDTIYIYIDRFLMAPGNEAGTMPLLRRLMELNWSLLLGKFEWDPTDGEVRLAMILNTDSNFDRRAFRSAIRGIGQLADRFYNELSRLQRTATAGAEGGEGGR